MAEAIVAETVAVIVEKLGTQAYEEIMYARDQNTHLKRLQELKTTAEATLLDADSLESCSNAQRDMLNKLGCALAELDDFLDEKVARSKLKEVTQGNKFIKVVQLFINKPNQLFSSLREANKLKAIMHKFQRIARDHAQFGDIISLPFYKQVCSLSHETTWSHAITDVVVGREGDRDNIINMLTDDSIYSEFVTSIVGIGGVGKTTLAQYVYNDERMKSCFDVRFWVSMSYDFSVKQVLENILGLACDTNENPPKREIHQLYDHFHKVIGGQKILLVLDNIWDQDGLRLKWLQLKRLIALGAYGSKVLITTRFQTVAGIMDSVGPYLLEDLTEHDSWLLFQHVAFTKWQDPGVEAIGQEIAKMCPKVPLVIRSIAGLLASKRTVQEWKAFRDDQLANFSSYGRDIMQTLKLSYDKLDVRLKLCVVYCSLFPKGFEYDKDEMVRLWISLGYVEPLYRSQSLEEAAGAYMLNLVNSGFFKIKSTNKFDSNLRLTMHDMMHDLVLSIAGIKYKMADSDIVEFDDRVQHVSFGGTRLESSWEIPSSLFKIEHLQSFLLAMPRHCKLTMKTSSIYDKFLRKFTSLRVLDLHKLGIKTVPRTLGDLLCLRYLDLSRNPIVKLPKSITRLINLLSLDLSWCYKLQELPEDIGKLKNLRHLCITGCDALSHMPMELGNLIELQTLDTFILREKISENKYVNGFGGIAELKNLSNLRGSLTIQMFGRTKDAAFKAKGENIKSLDKLLSLRLEFNNGSINDDENLIEILQPNATVIKLYINGYAGEKLPSWMRDQLHFWLPNLVEIWIFGLEHCKCLCSFGRLPHLRDLNLCSLKNLEYIEETCWGTKKANSCDIMVEQQAPLFLSVEKLLLHDIPELKGWQRISNDEENSRCSVGDFLDKKQAFSKLRVICVDKMDWVISMTREFRGMDSLKYISVYNCEDLKAIPECIGNLSTLKVLVLDNCSIELKERCQNPTGEDWPKVQHISAIHFLLKDTKSF